MNINLFESKYTEESAKQPNLIGIPTTNINFSEIDIILLHFSFSGPSIIKSAIFLPDARLLSSMADEAQTVSMIHNDSHCNQHDFIYL